MGMDLDYVFAENAIQELLDLVQIQKHGKREKITNEIIEFVDKMKLKWIKQI